MPNDSGPDDKTIDRPRTVRVTFVLPAASGARSAAIAGEFNDWSIDANPMERDVRGAFTATLDLAVGRHYEYRFWIDDAEWENDWYADSYVPNEYGGNNSQIDLTAESPRVRMHLRSTTKRRREAGEDRSDECMTEPSSGYGDPMKDTSQDAPALDAATTESATVTGVLDAYAAGGFTGQFSAVEGARLECHSCGTTVDAAGVEMSSLRRLEGASDPDDMVAIVALTCPSCASRGTVVLGFGPASSAEDSDVLGALRDQRGDDRAPGNSPPGETVGDDSPTANPSGADPSGADSSGAEGLS